MMPLIRLTVVLLLIAGAVAGYWFRALSSEVSHLLVGIAIGSWLTYRRQFDLPPLPELSPEQLLNFVKTGNTADAGAPLDPMDVPNDRPVQDGIDHAAPVAY